MQTLAIGEDNVIRVGTSDKPLRDIDGVTVADATVTAQLKTADLGDDVGDSIDLEPGDELSALAGTYTGIISGVGLERDAYYYLEITIAGTGSGFRRIKCQAKYHAEEP